MKWGKTMAVILGAVIVTALGIDAADTMNGSSGTLLSQVIGGNESGSCGEGMAKVENIPGISCIDMFEATTGDGCPVASPETLLASLQNMETPACVPASRADTLPWRYITRDQAMQACARVGKRLPTSEEWYTLSLGLTAVHDSCNIASKTISKSGSHSACVTPHGAYDLVGNVWEWVSDDVIDGMYKAQKLPENGYVSQVDQGGMAIATAETEQELFGSDYFWARADGAYGVIRGGYYDSGKDGGLYTVHADTLPTTASAGIGFRCVK